MVVEFMGRQGRTVVSEDLGRERKLSPTKSWDVLKYVFFL